MFACGPLRPLGGAFGPARSLAREGGEGGAPATVLNQGGFCCAANVVQVYHPNIDLEGKICLNILREDWKPVLSISSVIYGLQFLFLDPNPDDPLNKEAAQQFTENPRLFESNVQRAINHGHVINNTHFPPCTL